MRSFRSKSVIVNLLISKSWRILYKILSVLSNWLWRYLILKFVFRHVVNLFWNHCRNGLLKAYHMRNIHSIFFEKIVFYFVDWHLWLIPSYSNITSDFYISLISLSFESLCISFLLLVIFLSNCWLHKRRTWSYLTCFRIFDKMTFR